MQNYRLEVLQISLEIKKTAYSLLLNTNLWDFAGFSDTGGRKRSFRTLWYLLIRSNIWIQGKDALQVDLRQKHERTCGVKRRLSTDKQQFCEG